MTSVLDVGRRLGEIGLGRSGRRPPLAGYNGWWDSAHEECLTVDPLTGNISEWVDLSGSGFHLVQATDASRPRFNSTRTINGIVCPEFYPTRFMACACPRDDRTAATFVVALVDSVAAGVRTMVGASNTQGNVFRISANDLQSTTHAAVLAEDSNVISAGTAFALGQLLTATDITHYTNGIQETDANATGYTAGRTMLVGCNHAGAEGFDGLIAEIISYPFSPTDPEADSVMTYLRNKWGTA